MNDQKKFINEKYGMNILKNDCKSFVDRTQLLMTHGVMLEGDRKHRVSIPVLLPCFCKKKKNLQNGKDRCNMVKRQGT